METRYYKFDNSYGAMRRNGHVFEYLDINGNWIEDISLVGKFVGGDTDYEEISEEEAEQLAESLKRKSQGT